MTERKKVTVAKVARELEQKLDSVMKKPRAPIVGALTAGAPRAGNYREESSPAPGRKQVAPLPPPKNQKNQGGLRHLDRVEVKRALALIREIPKSEDDGEWVDDGKVPDSISIPAGVLRGVLGKGGYYRLHLNGYATIGTLANGKYKVAFNTLDGYPIANVASVTEFSSLAAIFGEYFVHSCTLQYEPINAFGGTYNGTNGATSPNNYTFGLVAIGAVQHNTSVVADSSSSISHVADDSQHLITNMGRKWTFRWKNIDKFNKNADLDPSSGSQRWKGVTDNTYGGNIEGAYPVAAATTGSTTQPQASITLGYAMVRWDVSFRYRE